MDIHSHTEVGHRFAVRRVETELLGIVRYTSIAGFDDRQEIVGSSNKTSSSRGLDIFPFLPLDQLPFEKDFVLHSEIGIITNKFPRTEAVS